jgi:hypothetical protein
LSKSLVSIARTKVSTIWLSLNASSGVMAPCAAALTIVPIAAAMSEALRIGGTASWIGRSRRGAMMRSRQIRSAPSLPPSASSTAFRFSASASLSKSASAASVALLRAPGRRPAGLPDRPFSNGRPGPLAGCFCSESTAMPISSMAKRPFAGGHLAAEYR